MARKRAGPHPGNLYTLTPDAQDIFVAKLARCFWLITEVTNGPNNGAALAMHIGEPLRKGEDLSMLMETLKIMTNQNVVQVQRTLNKVQAHNNNVAGIPLHLALATMKLNRWEVPPMLPTVDEFTLYHSSRRADLEVIGKQQLLSLIHI